MLPDSVTMKVKYVTNCRTFLSYPLKFCDRNLMCGCIRNKRVMQKQPTLE